jgi:uncharacterized membrane protein HdeD (DUF308 family)
MQTALLSSLRAHWKLFLIEGIVLVVLGLAAIMLPLIATIAIAIIIGWVFLLSGVLGLAATFKMRRAPGFWWSLFSRASCCWDGRCAARFRSLSC